MFSSKPHWIHWMWPQSTFTWKKKSKPILVNKPICPKMAAPFYQRDFQQLHAVFSADLIPLYFKCYKKNLEKKSKNACQLFKYTRQQISQVPVLNALRTLLQEGLPDFQTGCCPELLFSFHSHRWHFPPRYIRLHYTSWSHVNLMWPDTAQQCLDFQGLPD